MANGHDSRYKKLFSNPETVRQLLVNFVDLDIVHEFDYSSMERVDHRFVSDQFKQRESDLIYKIDCRGKDAYIFFLIEFQSEVDYTMSFRVLEYIIQFYLSLKGFDAMCRRREVPEVLPVVLYNGEAKWDSCTRVEDHINSDSGIRRYVPKFGYYLISENDFDKDRLIRIKNAVSSIFLIENSNPEEIYENIRILPELIKHEKPEIIKLIERWIKNLFEDTGADTSEVEKAFKGVKGVSTMLETTIKKLREQSKAEGKERGIEQGIEKEREKTVLNMLKKGIDDSTIMEITGLSRKRIKELKNRK